MTTSVNPTKFAQVGLNLLALAAGALFPLGFAPFDLWWLPFLSILLLLVTLQTADIRQGTLRFYLYGVGLYGIGVSWIYVSIHDHGGASPLLAGLLVLGFVLAISLIHGFFGYGYMRFKALVTRPLLFLLLCFPACWLIREWTYTWFLTGFPWLFAGYSQLETPFSNLAPLLGVMGVSYAVVMTACLLFAALLMPATRLMSLAGMAVLIVLVVALGQVKWVTPTDTSLTVSAVQGNIDQRIKWARRSVWPIIQTYQGLSENEWGRDLIVWPEAAITVYKEQAVELLAEWDSWGKQQGTGLVLGIPDTDGNSAYNTAIGVGTADGQYVKRRLVPFGEYVPLESVLRGLIQFFDLPMSHNGIGPWQQPLMTLDGHTLSMAICYEIVYADLVRGEEPPDLLLTISNDTWFGHSIGPHQHLQMAQMRSLENGRYLVRATNNGVTAIIDSEGKITGQLPQFESGVLRGEVRIMDGVTPFSRIGSWPIMGWAFLMMVLGLALRNSGDADIARVQQSSPSTR